MNAPLTIDHEPFDLDAEIGAAMRESIKRGQEEDAAHRERGIALGRQERWNRARLAGVVDEYKAAWEAVFKRPYPVARGE